MTRVITRIQKELKGLRSNPTPGIDCWPVSEDNILELEASIIGPKESPYSDGIFQLQIKISDRYPFEPPSIRFLTQIYHPNIDNEGRICLDILKGPPSGAWKPSLNLSSVLLSLQVLLSSPNPNDPLSTEIANEIKSDYPLFLTKAAEFTKKYAMQLIEPENCTTINCTSIVEPTCEQPKELLKEPSKLEPIVASQPEKRKESGGAETQPAPKKKKPLLSLKKKT